MSDSLPFDGPRPRLCHIRKWPDFSGYGFNLHAERGKAGQFIGTVDAQSPAEAANLRAGDRIIEVNGTNIGSENHQQVVQRIKAVPDETRLLVVDDETDSYYKEHKMIVRGDMDNVDVRLTPAINPFTNPTPGTRSLHPTLLPVLKGSPQNQLATQTRHTVSPHGYRQFATDGPCEEVIVSIGFDLL